MSSSIKLRSDRSSRLLGDAGGSFRGDPVAISATGETLSLSKQAQRTHTYLSKYGEPLNYPVDAAAWAIGIGRSTLWEMIKKGDVQTVKIGRRRLIPKEEVHRIKSGTALRKVDNREPKGLPDEQ